MRDEPITIAVTQMACSWNIEENLRQAEALIRQSAAKGAELVLLQELFAMPYFGPEQSGDYFSYAAAFADHPILARFAKLARELQIVLPISYFERAVNNFYNSVAVIDADGRTLGNYRKTHIPQGPGYQEKFYFTPGDTGWKVWSSAVGTIGVGICWDQWFPEAARSMALLGADLLLYPTAIGSEPDDPALDSRAHWQRVMQGHAGANMCGLAASNRIKSEEWKHCRMDFYGHSFIADEHGEIIAELDGEEGFALASLDLAAMRQQRWKWGLFRDRRPECYGLLTSPPDLPAR
ncbi:MAG: N-carbamoylputrescine amidase [Pseudomonadota bacterium]